MITCVTLNPSLDSAIFVDKLRGRDVKAKNVSYRISGKAINAADVLRAHGSSFRSLAFLGQAGKFASLDSWHQAIGHSRAIRQNFSFYEGERLVAHVRSPFQASLAEMLPLLDLVSETVGDDDILLFGGSLPDLNSVDRAGLITKMANLPGRLVLDISSLTLEELQTIGPDTIKLNTSEFRVLLGIDGDRALIHTDLERVHQVSGAVVILTQGPGDILAIDRTSKAAAFSIATDFTSNAQSVVGSGDAFLAGYVSGLSEGVALHDAIMRGIVFGTARQQAVALDRIDFRPEALRAFIDAPILREKS